MEISGLILKKYNLFNCGVIQNIKNESKSLVIYCAGERCSDLLNIYDKYDIQIKGIVVTDIMNNWGIYDDTSDLDRAICLADAYFGDHSSVVQLCQKVGMPIMIQNVNVDYG